MMAAHVSEQMSHQCGLREVSDGDDPDTKAKLHEVLRTSQKFQRRAHVKSLKTKTFFNSKRAMVNDDPCPAEFDCETDVQTALLTCYLDPSVVDEDTLMACFAANLSDDCHDCVCDALADEGLNCP